MADETVELKAKLSLDTSDAEQSLKDLGKDVSGKSIKVSLPDDASLEMPKDAMGSLSNAMSGPKGLKAMGRLVQGVSSGLNGALGAIRSMTNMITSPKVAGIITLIIALISMFIKLMSKTDTWKVMKESFQKLMDVFSDELASNIAITGEIIKEVLDAISTILRPILRVAAKIFDVTIKPLLRVLKIVTSIIKMLEPLLNMISQIILAILSLFDPDMALASTGQKEEKGVKSSLDTWETSSDATEQTADNTEETNDYFSGFIEEFRGIFAGFDFSVLTDLIGQIIGIVNKLFETLMPIVRPILELIANIIAPVVQVIDGVLGVIVRIIERVVGFVSKIVDILRPILGKLIEAIGKIISFIAQLFEPLMPIINFIFDLVGGIFDVVFDILGGILEGITPLLEGIGNVLGWIFDAIGNVFGGSHGEGFGGGVFNETGRWGDGYQFGDVLGTVADVGLGIIGKGWLWADGGTLDVGAQIWGMNEPGNPEFMFNAGGHDSVINKGILSDAMYEALKRAGAGNEGPTRLEVSVKPGTPAGPKELVQMLLPSLKFALK